MMTDKRIKLRIKRFDLLFAKLAELFPEKKTELDFSSPWELLVAVILSAQCTDHQVNKVTKKLFRKYPKIEDCANASRVDIESIIYSTGFYRNKAIFITGAAKKLLKDFDGQIPQTIDGAVTIPGVGRKTANVVLQNLYDNHEGVAVDTHVQRFAVRYELSDFEDPERIEKDLVEIIPPEKRRIASYYFKQYGRTFGPARNWQREQDPLQKIFRTKSV